MGCGCECIAKAFLITLNILTGLIGFILLAVGVVVQFAGSFVEPLLKSFADQLSNQGYNVDVKHIWNEILPIINAICIPLIVIGAFFFLIAMFGCYGACCKNTCCLLVYCIAVSIVFIGMLVGIIYILAAADTIKNTSKANVQKEINEEYVGYNATNGFTLMLNFVQISLKCCGMDNWEDFNTTTKWEKKISITKGPYTFNGTVVIPLSCCKMSGTFPNVKLVDDTCPLGPTTNTSYMNTGCFTKIEDYVAEYTTYYYLALAFPLVFLAIVMALGWFLWKTTGSSDVGSAAKAI